MRNKIMLLFILFCITTGSLYTQENEFFIKLSQKQLATFNDAITLIKLLYDERDDSNIYLENIIWAASKKLFKVSIPITEKQINPVITRKEFAFWLCKLFELNGKEYPINRKAAYNACLEHGIIVEGRGAEDSFTGQELINAFAYFDYYVRVNNIKRRDKELKLYEDGYDSLPEWRKQLYRELEEQRAKEKKLKEEKRKKWKEKFKKNKTEEDKEVIKEDETDKLYLEDAQE